jgi:hypothetical protein
MTYIVGHDYICNDCFAEYIKKNEEENEKRGIKQFFKKLFG